MLKRTSLNVWGGEFGVFQGKALHHPLTEQGRSLLPVADGGTTRQQPHFLRNTAKRTVQGLRCNDQQITGTLHLLCSGRNAHGGRHSLLYVLSLLILCRGFRKFLVWFLKGATPMMQHERQYSPVYQGVNLVRRDLWSSLTLCERDDRHCRAVV